MRIRQLQEGYKVLPAIDKERYPEINGLEGPFRTLNGAVVYYDPKEGKYYDKDRDMYLSYEEFRQMDTDYSGMKDERDISVKEANVDEALTLDYSRYMRSHGKKPRPGLGVWMFTTTDMGEPTEDDMFQFSGELADAKRAAAKWAKDKGAYRFYVMENDPCWKGYKQIGMKKKNGKEVPNCVPKKD